MISSLERKFEKIGASVKIVQRGFRDPWGTIQQVSPFVLDVVSKDGHEEFEIALRIDMARQIELSVLEVRPEQRHLVLLARQIAETGQVIVKSHFLCGHDERHLFVAAVGACSTVAAAKESLKPDEIRSQETGLSTEKRNRRKTKLFQRQGEWFFLPTQRIPHPNLVLQYEPLSRGAGSKPHIAQFCYREGGEIVQVCQDYPRGLTLEEYAALIRDQPQSQYLNWRTMTRDAHVYVKGTIRHPDHATIVLDTWHRVLMNTERFNPSHQAVAFLD